MTGVLLLIGIWMAAAFFRSGKPLWHLFLSTAGGGAAFWAASAMAAATGVVLPLNLATALSAAVLGAPGIGTLWLLQLLWR